MHDQYELNMKYVSGINLIETTRRKFIIFYLIDY